MAVRLISFFILFSIIGFSGCQKELIEKSKYDLTIDEGRELLKKYYAENEIVTIRDNQDIAKQPLVFDWDIASLYHSSTKNLDIIEVPLKEGRVQNLFYNKDNLSLNPTEFLMSQSYCKLIILKNENGQTSLFLMKITPNPKNIDQINITKQNTFEHYNPNFSGIIQFATLNDNPIKTYYIENNSNYLIEKTAEEGFNQNEISIRDIEVECSPITATVTCPCESHVPGQACNCYQQPYYDSGLWCRVTIGGSGGYSDLGFSDFYGHINTGTTSPDNSGGGGETSSTTSYYQYLMSIYDAPQIKKANRIKDSLCTQYGLNLPITSFWDIFGDASTDFINANTAWTHNQPINKLELFENAFKELIFLKNISYTLDTPDNSTTSAYKWLKDHYAEFLFISNNFDASHDDEFARWSIEFLMDYPNTTQAQFENWFMGISEGYDGEYDSAYWEDPNLTFPQQNLPSWADFEAAFPKDTDPLYDTPEKMYNSLGGTIATFYSGPETNTCAVRLSKALNYSGVVIPYISNKTFVGSDGKYYFKAAYELNIWMRKTFGTNPATSTTPLNINHFQISGSQAGVHGSNLPSLLKGKKGIYSIYSSDFSWASGHADMLYPNSKCANNCHFGDAPIYRLDVWILN